MQSELNSSKNLALQCLIVILTPEVWTHNQLEADATSIS